ncbi:hypothetical protein ABMA46_07255 [Mesorhizobium sp. CN5-321]
MSTAHKLGLHGVKQVVGHDLQFWSFGGMPLIRWVRSRQALAGVGFFDHADLVPDDLADIDVIAQNTGATGLEADKGGRGPLFAPWRANALPRELMANGLRASALGVFLKNAQHDSGFVGYDPGLATVRWVRLIAIGFAASGQSLFDFTAHAAPDLVHVILAE